MDIDAFKKKLRDSDINSDLIKEILEKATTASDEGKPCVIRQSEYINSEERKKEFEILKYHYERLIHNHYIDGDVDIMPMRIRGGIEIKIVTIANDGITPKGIELLKDIQSGNNWNI